MSEPTRTEIAGLTCAQWAGDGPVVLALHGLTSTSEVWRAVAEALPGRRIVAPDLPGRGGSAAVRVGPGLAGHAAAVLRLAGELGLDDVVVAGHSMGAFLGPLVAAGLGHRVRKVVLLDGGVAPESNPHLSLDLVRAAFGAQVEQLGQAWPDVPAFVQAIYGESAVARPDLNPRMLQWAGYLLDGPAGELRPRIDAERLIDDAVDTLIGEATLPALADLDAPVAVLVAAHGKDDQAEPFLNEAALATGRAQLPRIATTRLAANHLTMLFDPAVPEALS